MKRFKVNLHNLHSESGLSAYAVAKQTKLAQNTVRKYVESSIVVDYIPMTIVQLANFYGVDWRDPNIIEIVEQ